MNNDDSKRMEQEYHGFLGLIDKNMDLARWGFVQTYSNANKNNIPFTLIYDCPQCRVKFRYDKMDYGAVFHNFKELVVWYGRSHTANDSENSFASGKATHRWYWNYPYVLMFLDGIRPEEVLYKSNDELSIIREFKNSSLNEVSPGESDLYDVIRKLRLHNRIWEHYGKDFFDLFDVRKPDLWGKYVYFHNEVKRFLYENRKRQAKIETPFKQLDDFIPDELL